MKFKEDISYYIKLAGQYKNLSKKEEDKLFLEFKKGNKEAGKKLLLHYLKLMIKQAFKYITYGVSIEDLIHEGIIAFYEALPNYKISKTSRIQYYVFKFIRGAMLKYIFNNLTIMNIFDSHKDIILYSKFNKISDFTDIKNQKERFFYLLTHGKELSLECEKLQRKDRKQDEFEGKFEDIIPYDDYDVFEKIINEKENEMEEFYNFLQEEINKLNKQEKFILFSRYFNDEIIPYEILSQIMQIDKNVIYSIEQNLLKKLRLKYLQYKRNKKKKVKKEEET